MKTTLFIASVCVQMAASSSIARGRTDEREAALQSFWRCLRGHPCQVAQVFRGAKALGHFDQQERKRRKRGVQIKTTELVSTMADAAWKTDWQAAITQLASVGYSEAELRKLGAGQSIVQASPREAIALTRNVVEIRGKTNTTVLFVVLWRIGTRYLVASWECSPALLTKFMLVNRPQ
jgi:hypothetical protein